MREVRTSEGTDDAVEEALSSSPSCSASSSSASEDAEDAEDADDEEDDVLDELALRFLRVRGLFVDKGCFRLGRGRPMQYAPRQGLP